MIITPGSFVGWTSSMAAPEVFVLLQPHIGWVLQ
jgi:hypothetical protein